MVPWHARFGGFVWDVCLILAQSIICVPAGHGVIPLGLGLLGMTGVTQILFGGGILLMLMLLFIKIRWLYVVLAATAISGIVTALATLLILVRTNWYDGKMLMFAPFFVCLLWRVILVARIAFSRE